MSRTRPDRRPHDFRPPSIEEIVADPAYARWVEALSRPLVTDAVREAVDEVRRAPDASRELLDRRVRAHLERWRNRRLGPVVNATGVLIHTNLGRAPMDAALWSRVTAPLEGYGTLEYDLETGDRGRRGAFVHRQIARAAGSEAGLVVNNCAGAVLLMLAQARGKSVLVSRGELVQIGGGFRIPEILAQSGARLVEVGTTNRTSASDYAQAVTADTAAVLKVHRSNFDMSGFVAEASTRELARLCRERGLLLIEDLGSGALEDVSPYGLPRERTLQEAVRDGADLVSVSGDKLLGGPQAGLIAGRQPAVDRCARHPLYRALRPDKITLAALEWVLDAHLSGTVEKRLPLYRLLACTPGELRRRAEAAVEYLRDPRVSVAESRALTGGGTLPGASLPSVALVIRPVSPDETAAALRCMRPPVIARISDDEVRFDLRTVFPTQDPHLRAAVASVLSA